jgi:hypothetical protein
MLADPGGTNWGDLWKKWEIIHPTSYKGPCNHQQFPCRKKRNFQIELIPEAKIDPQYNNSV